MKQRKHTLFLCLYLYRLSSGLEPPATPVSPEQRISQASPEQRSGLEFPEYPEQRSGPENLEHLE